MMQWTICRLAGLEWSSSQGVVTKRSYSLVNDAVRTSPHSYGLKYSLVQIRDRIREFADAAFHLLNHGVNGLTDNTEKIRAIWGIRGHPWSSVIQTLEDGVERLARCDLTLAITGKFTEGFSCLIGSFLSVESPLLFLYSEMENER